MTTSITAGSAQIYEFPLRGRFALNAREDTKTALESTQAVRAVVGSGWYHDAAIQDERSRNN